MVLAEVEARETAAVANKVGVVMANLKDVASKAVVAMEMAAAAVLLLSMITPKVTCKEIWATADKVGVMGVKAQGVEVEAAADMVKVAVCKAPIKVQI